MDIQEVEVPLRAVRVYAHCGKCGARLGDPIPLLQLPVLSDKGDWTSMNDHKYGYTCPVCRAQTESDERYPRIAYREIEEA